ncbi:MAG TPA: helix-turn-helix domain-containing GNAT family N-acetyltransferase [Terracidiphilus sp.]|nr:helix-turn-helix domain-containing GNAT family N-acetyltransferase [Terracidiphilus sp.]
MQLNLAHQIRAVREFNRFYTARLGLLRKRHLQGEFSLTEARILYEIGARPGITASELRETLFLDRGYISRMLGSLTRRKLLRRTNSTADGREKLLTLTIPGERAVAKLNESSDRHILEILSAIELEQREALVHSLECARQILAGTRKPEVEILRLTEPSPEALEILEEYYEAVHVLQRDNADALERLVTDPRSALWLAKVDREIVGCVVLRNLPSLEHAGECKRLYVRPAARGKHVAGMLLDALEEHARSIKLEWIYLDTYDDLKPAIALYEQRGYERCARYNNNPQATLFMRKRLNPAPASP